MSILKPETIVFTFNLFIFSSEILKNVDIPKAVLIFLPIVFSQVGRSAAALDLLGAGSFSFHPQLREQFPQENWDQLLSASYEACKLAIAMEGASDNDTERDNLAIATEDDGASDNPTERDDLAIATEGATGCDNATERDNLAITTEGDKPTITESDAEIGTSSRGRSLKWLLQVVLVILKLILETFAIHL